MTASKGKDLEAGLIPGDLHTTPTYEEHLSPFLGSAWTKQN